MKSLLITLISVFVIYDVQAQTVEEARKDLHYKRVESAKNKLLNLVKKENGDNDAFYWLGEIYLQQKKIDSAYKMYTENAGEILHIDYSKKNSPLIYIGWAHLLLDSGMRDTARQQMEMILSKTKYKNTDALMAVAKANIQSPNGDINWAIDLLNRAAKRDKKNPEIYNALGDAYRKLIDGSNAVRSYDMALEKDENNAEAMYKKGKIYKTQNNTEVYLDRFTRAYEMDSLYTPVLYELYEYYFKMDVTKAELFLDKYIQNADPLPIHAYMKANMLYASRQFKEAVAAAQNIIARDKDSVKPWIYKTIAYSQAALGDSLLAYQALSKYFNMQDSLGYTSKDLAFKAHLLESAGADTAEIKAAYLQALKMETDKKAKVEYLQTLAELANQQNDRSEEAMWREELYLNKSNPSNLDIYRWGMALYQSDDFEKADSVFALYEEKYPDQIYGYLYRAKSNTFIDSSMEKGLAVPFYMKVLEIGEKDEQKNKGALKLAYEYLGAYEANITKDYSASLNYFNRLLEIDPGNEDAVKNTQLLKKWMASSN